MQILITDSTLVRTRVLHFRRWQVALGGLLLAGMLMLLSGLVYHFIFLAAAREGWPVASRWSNSWCATSSRSRNA